MTKSKSEPDLPVAELGDAYLLREFLARGDLTENAKALYLYRLIKDAGGERIPFEKLRFYETESNERNPK